MCIRDRDLGLHVGPPGPDRSLGARAHQGCAGPDWSRPQADAGRQHEGPGGALAGAGSGRSG
eukprot:8841656-Alexandrium_andersonii.AAC.1